jgi:hypothetical protein
LIVGDDFNTVMLPYTDTRVGGSEIDSDSWSLSFSGHWILLFLVRCEKREKDLNEEENENHSSKITLRFVRTTIEVEVRLYS